MLGPKAFDSWKKGKIDLGDLAGFVVDPQWGATSSRRSVAAAEEFARAGRPYHLADVPPGLLTVEGADQIDSAIEAALAELKALKMQAELMPVPPTFLDEFRDCIGAE